METKLLEFYEIPNSDKREYLNNLSDAELQALINDTTSCVKALDELADAYDALEQQKKKGHRLFIGIWWLIKKEAKQEWEEGCRVAEAELNKKESKIKASCIWNLVDIEMDALIAQYPRRTKQELLTRNYGVVFLTLKLKNDVAPVLLAEYESRE